jgi:hypothetical protein
MPFFDDSGPRPEEEHGLLWRSAALIGDQLERMILLNIFWAAQLLPALAAWAFGGLPVWLRIAFTLYTALALIPATAVLFDMLTQTARQVPLSIEMAKESLKTRWKPAFMKLMPLYSLFFWLGLAASLDSQNNIQMLDVTAQLGLLFLALFSLYWGALFTVHPEDSLIKIFTASVRQVWRKPGQTLLAALLTLAALILGVISIGGIFLIVPVLVVLIQVQLFQTVNAVRST